MMENGSIRQLLHNRHVAIVDGAMATELEKHGVDTSGELWSAAALLHQRQAIYDVHMSYLEAGADFATTNTYQANPEAFANIGLSESESRTLIAQAVQEAKRACTDWSQRHPSRRTPLVAGSVGPYGAFLADGSEYTGDYALSGQQYQDFHRVRMQVMAESGVDLFAFETMPNIGEVKALTGLLRDEFPNMTAWLSFSLSENGDMADGTDLAEAVSYIQNVPQIEAVGVNCVPMDRVLQQFGPSDRLRTSRSSCIRTTVTSTIRKPKPGRLIPPVPNRPSPIWYRNGSTREPDSLEDAAERLQTISEP